MNNCCEVADYEEEDYFESRSPESTTRRKEVARTMVPEKSLSTKAEKIRQGYARLGVEL